MGVDVQGGVHSRLTQPLAYYLGVNPLLQQQGGVGVTQVVEAQAVQSGLFRQPPPRVP